MVREKGKPYSTGLSFFNEKIFYSALRWMEILIMGVDKGYDHDFYEN
ncbi:hypothetical protein HBHAL_1501 [Halobacillus halophilus DSM 2266]|uniref:Uncharacterized protein n=1 Tax=Halobacillus halophilus (strain ATCC 35676 / DSM 2266 / JCM 20832 / KCTC 3685 / LMG 17431 / NBRC 102448 / NCIMB 2269) TaxID=866895 RepID=I0JIA4_HALH3|nr:hypothetical protein HBHAL_1501 [Halobacillus halophilus DSM 2266]